MDSCERQRLLQEIRESEGSGTASPLAGLMRRWLECQDAQAASRASGGHFRRRDTGTRSGPARVSGPCLRADQYSEIAA
jgi:hypothetical protein